MVGSSLGGWIGLLAAIARPERVRGFIGIAPAIDMTRRLWQRADDAVKARLRRDGVWMRPSEYDPAGYPITLRLIEEGDDHLLLPGPIPFDGPVRLLHGQRDDAVPWRLSLEIAEALRSDRVEVTLIKDGDHRLSGDADIARLLHAVETDRRSIGRGLIRHQSPQTRTIVRPGKPHAEFLFDPAIGNPLVVAIETARHGRQIGILER